MDIETLRAEKSAAYEKVVGRAESARAAVSDYKERSAGTNPDLLAQIAVSLSEANDKAIAIDNELKTNMYSIGAYGILSTGEMHGLLEDVPDEVFGSHMGKRIVDGIYDLSGHQGGTLKIFSNIQGPDILNFCFYSTADLAAPLTLTFYNNNILIDTINIAEDFEIGLYVHTTEPKTIVDIYQTIPEWKNFNRLSVIDTSTGITDISNITNSIGIGTTTITQENPRFGGAVKTLFSSLPYWQQGYDSTDVTSVQFTGDVFPILSNAPITMDIESGFTVMKAAASSTYGINIFSDTDFTMDTMTPENSWDSGYGINVHPVNSSDSTLLFTTHCTGNIISVAGAVEDRRIKLYDFNENTGVMTLLDEKYAWKVVNSWHFENDTLDVFVVLEAAVDGINGNGRLTSYRLNKETLSLETASTVETSVTDYDMYSDFTVDGIHYIIYKDCLLLTNPHTVYLVDPLNGTLRQKSLLGDLSIEAVAVNRKNNANIAVYSAPALNGTDIAIWRGHIVSDDNGDISITSITQLTTIPTGFRAGRVLYTKDKDGKKSCIFIGLRTQYVSNSIASKSCKVEMEDMLSTPIISDGWTHYLDFIYNNRRFYHCINFDGSSSRYLGVFTQNSDLSYTQKLAANISWNRVFFNVNGKQYFIEHRYDYKYRIYNMTISDQYLDWMAIGR